jgi:hypothetical protein
MSSNDEDDEKSMCDLCNDKGDTSIIIFFDDNGTNTKADVCSSCVGKCFHCNAALPTYNEFQCTVCEGITCPKCAFMVLGVKDKSCGARHCITCIQPVLRRRQRALGAHSALQ